MNKTATSPIFNLNDWYNQPLGAAIAKTECQQLAALPRALLGQPMLQLGSQPAAIWSGLPVFTLAPYLDTTPAANHLSADHTALPFSDNSIQTIFLPHVLECHANPQAVINACWNALAAEGHLLILGFNPYSLTQLFHYGISNRLKLPNTVRFYPCQQLCYWLKTTHYEIAFYRSWHFLPLQFITQTNLTWPKLENFANTWLQHCGSIYLVALKKRVVPLTPTRLRWRWRDLLGNKNGLTEPATGNLSHE